MFFHHLRGRRTSDSRGLLIQQKASSLGSSDGFLPKQHVHTRKLERYNLSLSLSLSLSFFLSLSPLLFSSLNHLSECHRDDGIRKSSTCVQANLEKVNEQSVRADHNIVIGDRDLRHITPDEPREKEE